MQNLAERAETLERDVDKTIYLLRVSLKEAQQRVVRARLNGFDIDGTLTGIGDTALYPASVDGLLRLRESGLPGIGVTGRHEGQILKLEESHQDTGTGLDAYIAEQGGYYMVPREERREFLLGTAEVEECIRWIRAQFAPALQSISSLHNVSFIPTSGGGHRMLFSIDAHTTDTATKIEDRDLHERLMDALRGHWKELGMEGNWHVGSSSTGTLEITYPDIQKDEALRRYAQKNGISLEDIVFYGDSGNDLPVFRMHGPLKVVVVNPHTKRELIDAADIAIVGRGNAAPVLHWIHQTRKRAGQL